MNKKSLKEKIKMILSQKEQDYYRLIKRKPHSKLIPPKNIGSPYDLDDHCFEIIRSNISHGEIVDKENLLFEFINRQWNNKIINQVIDKLEKHLLEIFINNNNTMSKEIFEKEEKRLGSLIKNYFDKDAIRDSMIEAALNHIKKLAKDFKID